MDLLGYSNNRIAEIKDITKQEAFREGLRLGKRFENERLKQMTWFRRLFKRF